MEHPPLPTSKPGAGQYPGKRALILCGRDVKEFLASLGPRRVVVRSLGVVALEDHPNPRHVTGSLPHQVLSLRRRKLGGGGKPH